jgi:hypothetical protein
MRTFRKDVSDSVQRILAFRNNPLTVATGGAVIFDGAAGRGSILRALNTTTGLVTPPAGGYSVAWAVQANSALALDLYWTSYLSVNGTQVALGQISYQRGATANVNTVGATVAEFDGKSTAGILLDHNVGAAQGVFHGAAWRTFLTMVKVYDV